MAAPLLRRNGMKFDLHLHSDMSDGTAPPEALPHLAAELSVGLIALTDHDTAAGADAAREAGRKAGVSVLSGIELDVQIDAGVLHMLGLGIDPHGAPITEYEAWKGRARAQRNAEMLDKLDALGVHMRDVMEHSRLNDTRLHMAKAIAAAGYAESISDAFDKYLDRGRPAYVSGERIGRREAVELIHAAGGLAVLAHPCKLKCAVQPLLHELAGYGLDGIEAFYPASTAGQTAESLSFARQYGLIVTCGSDFHGANRDAVIGCAWREHPLLAASGERFAALAREQTMQDAMRFCQRNNDLRLK